MKKIIYVVLGLIISSAVFIACTKDDNSTVTKENALSLIKKDIEINKFYPNVKNKYDYSSTNLNKFLNSNTDLVNCIKSTNRSTDSITLQQYKNAVIQFYSNSEHNAEEINDKFDFSLNNINENDDYKIMLDKFVNDGTIPAEEREIIKAYVDYFIQVDFNTLCQVSTTFIYYVNQSNFSELEKRGMLTIFDVLKLNKSLMDQNAQFNFLSFFQNISNNPASQNGKPTLEQKCAGNVIIGLLGGAATGNGIGACVGLACGLWTCYCDGCMG